MAKRSGRSKGSRNSEKTEGSDRSNKIDLDKDPDLNLDKPDDIDLGDKDIDVNFGELSKELGLWEDEESGQSVSVVAVVDVVPLGINISANGDIGTVGVDLGMPGDMIGIGANIQVNLETGDIIGGGGSIDYGGLSVGVDQIKKDGETCTTVTITYMGIGASYQRCRKDDDDDEKEPQKKPPGGSGDPLPPAPVDPPQIPGDPDRLCLVVFRENGEYYDLVNYLPTPNNDQCSGRYYYNRDKLTVNVSWAYPAVNIVASEFKLRQSGGNAPVTEIKQGVTTISLTGSGSRSGILWDPEIVVLNQTGDLSTSVDFLRGSVNACNNYLKYSSYYFNAYRENFAGGDCNHGGTVVISNHVKISVYFPDTGEIWNPPPKEPEKPREPDPPIPPENDMSNCCNLEPVMSLLRKVSGAIGTDQLPAKMPKSFLKNEGVRSISNLAELQVYQLEIIDQLIGKFPIELEIADTDPLTPGDQKKKVTLTNLAESIAELVGLAINGASDNAIQTSGVIKNLLEITLVRQAVLQNYYRLDAILDYLGAGLEEDEATFNSTISLPKDPNNISEDVAEFLQQSEIKFVYDKLSNPKDTLTAKLLPIQKAAGIIKAKYWKGFGKAGGDYTGAIKEWLKTYDPKNEQNETDWKDKLDKILEEYAKDQAGNIDKDRMPEIQNIKQIGSEPVPEPEAKK